MGETRGDAAVAVSRDEMKPIWRTLQFTVIPFFRAIVSIRREGTANVPRTGAFVIAPNHTTNIDPIIMGIGVFTAGRTPHFLGKASLFAIPVVKVLLKATGQIPVERAGSSRANPLSTAALVAGRGSGVIVYPEGTLTRDPALWPMRGKTGAVRLALGADIPLVPAAHWGTEKFLPPYGRWLRVVPRQHITVRFGEPVDLDDLRGLDLAPAVVNEATDRLMAAITALVADLRDEQAPTERWDPAAHNQSEFGRP